MDIAFDAPSRSIMINAPDDDGSPTLLRVPGSDHFTRTPWQRLAHVLLCHHGARLQLRPRPGQGPVSECERFTRSGRLPADHVSPERRGPARWWSGRAGLVDEESQDRSSGRRIVIQVAAPRLGPVSLPGSVRCHSGRSAPPRRFRRTSIRCRAVQKW